MKPDPRIALCADAVALLFAIKNWRQEHPRLPLPAYIDTAVDGVVERAEKVTHSLTAA